VRAAYGEDTYRRLQDIKARYDPDNVFLVHHNVPPPDRVAERGGPATATP